MKRLHLGVALLLVFAACGEDAADTPTQPVATSSAATTTTASSASTATTVSSTTTTTTGVPAELTVVLDTDILIYVVAGLGSVWATGALGPAPFLYKVDPATGVLDAAWELESELEPGTLSLSVGDEHVWVVLRSTVVRVDPETGAWDTIDFGKGPVAGTWLEYPWAVAAGDGAAWVVVVEATASENTYHLYKVDPGFTSPATAIVGHVELGTGSVRDVLVAEGRVWVLYEEPGDACGLLAIDPESVSVTDRIDLSGMCDLRIASLAAGGGYVFVANWAGRIRWIDTVANVEAKWTEGDSNGLVAYSAGTLWVGAHGRDFGLGAVLGSRSGGLNSTSLNVYNLHAGDLAATDDAIWLIVDEPSGLLRLVPDPLEPWGPDSVGDDCSATALNIGLGGEPDLPTAVDEMRRAIKDAAWSCDVDQLAELGLPGEFEWSLNPNAADDPAEHWRLDDVHASPLARIVELLALPSAVKLIDGIEVYVWPSAAAYDDWASVPAADRAALAGIFHPEDLDRFEADAFYSGSSLGIDADGDWLWYLTAGN